MDTSAKKLTGRHHALIHSEQLKVLSHVQREQGEWFINTLMLEGCEAPFRYKRKRRYRNLAGARVNLTYYRDSLSVAGLPMEVMSVVRIRVA